MTDPTDLSDHDQYDYLVAPRLPDGTQRFIIAWWEDEMPTIDMQSGKRISNRRRMKPQTPPDP
jgi:hypothetical protein